MPWLRTGKAYGNVNRQRYVRRIQSQNAQFARRRRIRARRDRSYRGQKTKIMLPMGGFPKSLMVKLKYVDTFTVNPSAGTISLRAFRANSLFDPDYTGTGYYAKI